MGVTLKFRSRASSAENGRKKKIFVKVYPPKSGTVSPVPLKFFVGSFLFSNDNVLVQNRFCHDQRHKQDDVLALSDETKHQTQEILKVQVCRFPEKDHALPILSIGKYEVLFFDRFQPSTSGPL
jgi:hypothetical protein